MKELNYFNEICDYENGCMSQDQKNIFEFKLINNDELKLEYSIYKKVETLFRDREVLRFKQQLEQTKELFEKIIGFFSMNLFYIVNQFFNKQLYL